MYSIHTTPGFIIGTRSTGEAGKILSIFTRDLGLVYAVAQGIRLEKSKLRYYTQDYDFGIFSLVRGKEVWRLTSAADLEVPEIIDKGHHSELIPRLALLLKRLLHGEEPHPELFNCIEACAAFLNGSSGYNLTVEQLATLESLTVLRMLHHLGYIGSDALLRDDIASNEITPELLEKLLSQRQILNQHINKALRESHL